MRDRLGDRFEELLELKRGVVRPVHAVHSVEIDRNRQQLAVHAREHSVLVRTPVGELRQILVDVARVGMEDVWPIIVDENAGDRKSTRLNSSHSQISYAVFCLKKKNQQLK